MKLSITVTALTFATIALAACGGHNATASNPANGLPGFHPVASAIHVQGPGTVGHAGQAGQAGLHKAHKSVGLSVDLARW